MLAKAMPIDTRDRRLCLNPKAVGEEEDMYEQA
jgi:hypothetical protein